MVIMKNTYLHYLKSIEKILEEGFLRSKRENPEWQAPLGLCGYIAHIRSNDNWVHEKLLKREIKILRKRRNVFYDHDGIKTDSDWKFIWKPCNHKSRKAFINKLIKEQECGLLTNKFDCNEIL